jgi:predicted nuclease with TOPRIM domain
VEKQVGFYKFTPYPNGYRCSHPGNQGGKYVKKKDYDALRAEIEKLQKHMDLIEKNNSMHRSRNDTLHAELERVRTEHDALKAKVEGLENDILSLPPVNIMTIHDAKGDVENLQRKVRKKREQNQLTTDLIGVPDRPRKEE